MKLALVMVLLFVLGPVSAASASPQPAGPGGFGVSQVPSMLRGITPAHIVPRTSARGLHSYRVPAWFTRQALSSRAVPLAEPFPRDAKTVPLWRYSFQYGGQTWGSTMVGTDPAAGSALTVVPVTIVTVRLTFARDGSTLDYPGMAQELLRSALFRPVSYVDPQLGTAQWADAYRRGDFWKQVSTTSPWYHTLLVPTPVVPVHWTVPASQGLTFFDSAANRTFGVITDAWMSQQRDATIRALHIDPRSLVVFLADDTYVTDNASPDDCFAPQGCYHWNGIHGALVSGRSVNTYAWAMFNDYGDLFPSTYNEHLYTVSHEFLEWLDDPLVSEDTSVLESSVPAWTSPYCPTGCLAHWYEVADPLEGWALGFPDSGLTDLLADAVFHPWFARTASDSLDGLYDPGGIFQTYSQGC